jgi:hypothetical protein
MKGFELSAEQAEAHNAKVRGWNNSPTDLHEAHRDVIESYGKQSSSPAPTKLPRAKFGNKKVVIDGLTFDSLKEGRRWKGLQLLVEGGQITQLERQRVFELIPPVVLHGRKKPAIRYVSDFSYMESGYLVIEDVKSAHTRTLAVYRLKAHLLKHVYGLEVIEV